MFKKAPTLSTGLTEQQATNPHDPDQILHVQQRREDEISQDSGHVANGDQHVQTGGPGFETSVETFCYIIVSLLFYHTLLVYVSLRFC